MFKERNCYEVAILAYLERGSLEKQRGGPSRSLCSRGNIGVVSSASCTHIRNILSGTL